VRRDARRLRRAYFVAAYAVTSNVTATTVASGFVHSIAAFLVEIASTRPSTLDC
jgi:hypothetical protein